MAKWLFKTEPGDYSWDRLVEDGSTEWDGVRNYQAALNMRAMKEGELAFFYRSMKDPAIVGTMRIIKEAYPVPQDPNSKFVLVDVAPVIAVEREVSLREIKQDERLADLALVRHSRLSVMPVGDKHWDIICEKAGIEPKG